MWVIACGVLSEIGVGVACPLGQGIVKETGFLKHRIFTTENIGILFDF